MPAAPQLQPDPYEQGLKASAGGHHLEAISCFEQALAGRPDDTRVLFALGNTARALGLVEAAQSFYGRVLELEPGRIEAVVNLANLMRSNAQYPAAEALLMPALARNPESPELLMTMGSVARETGRNAEAERHYRKALDIRPDYASAMANLADMHAEAGDHAEAFALYCDAIKHEPTNAQMRLNRAMLHFLTGNLRDGWSDYEARLKFPGKAIRADHGLKPWDGGNLKGKRLLLTAEQGVGDQIMFASVIPELSERAKSEGGSVILECEPRLVSLFARSFADVTVRPSHIETRGGEITAHYGWLKHEGGANRAIPAGSLPRYMRFSLANFSNPNAYLVTDTGENDRWRTFFSGVAPHIGICWRSGKLGGARTIQYAPLEMWGAFLRTVPGTIVCAQYDANQDEITALEALSGRKIVIPPTLNQKNELDRTAAMLSALEMVMSAPTAVSWLSAAAGTTTLKLLYETSWTSFGENFEPFAPACICVQPEKPGDWTTVFDKATAAIRARF